MEYVVRVKVVIPGGGWFGAAVDEFEMFIFAGRMQPSTVAIYIYPFITLREMKRGDIGHLHETERKHIITS